MANLLFIGRKAGGLIFIALLNANAAYYRFVCALSTDYCLIAGSFLCSLSQEGHDRAAAAFVAGGGKELGYHSLPLLPEPRGRCSAEDRSFRRIDPFSRDHEDRLQSPGIRARNKVLQPLERFFLQEPVQIKLLSDVNGPPLELAHAA